MCQIEIFVGKIIKSGLIGHKKMLYRDRGKDREKATLKEEKYNAALNIYITGPL